MMIYMYYRIVGIIMIALGCLFLTRKKIIVKQQYFMVCWCTVVFGGKAIVPFGGTYIDPYGFGGSAIIPIWTDNYLLIIAGLYLFFVIISFVFMKGRYDITNIKSETLMPAITNLLVEKGIAYEVIDTSVVLTNYDNKVIKCREFLNSTEINFRSIIRLPFYVDIKDSLILKAKLIQETVFPIWGVIYIMMGIILIVAVQLIVEPIR